MKFWMAEFQLQIWNQFLSEISDFLSSNGRRVYFFDLRDSKLIPATLSIIKSESSQDFRRFAAYYEVRTVFPSVLPDLTIWISLDESSWNLKFPFLRRFSLETSSLTKIWQNVRCLNWWFVHIIVNIRLNSVSN